MTIKVSLLENVCKRNNFKPHQGLAVLKRTELEQCPKCKEKTLQKYTSAELSIWACLNCEYEID